MRGLALTCLLCVAIGVAAIVFALTGAWLWWHGGCPRECGSLRIGSVEDLVCAKT